MTTERDRILARYAHEARYVISQAQCSVGNLPADSILDRVKDLMERGLNEEARRLVSEWRAAKRAAVEGNQG